MIGTKVGFRFVKMYLVHRIYLEIWHDSPFVSDGTLVDLEIMQTTLILLNNECMTQFSSYIDFLHSEPEKYGCILKQVLKTYKHYLSLMEKSGIMGHSKYIKQDVFKTGQHCFLQM